MTDRADMSSAFSIRHLLDRILRRRVAAEPSSPAFEAGLSENDLSRRHISTQNARKSTKDNPQGYGKDSRAFDLEGFALWLRRRFPRYTAINVEVETGVPAGTVENWLLYRSQPSTEHFALLILRFGPGLLRASIRGEPAWLIRAAAVAEADAEAEPEREG